MASRTFRVGGIVSDSIADWWAIGTTNSLNAYSTGYKITTTAYYIVPAGQTGYPAKYQVRATVANSAAALMYADTASANDISAPSGFVALLGSADVFVVSTANTVTVFDLMGNSVPAQKYIGTRERAGLGSIAWSMQGISI